MLQDVHGFADLWIPSVAAPGRVVGARPAAPLPEPKGWRALPYPQHFSFGQISDQERRGERQT